MQSCESVLVVRDIQENDVLSQTKERLFSRDSCPLYSTDTSGEKYTYGVHTK